MKDQERRRPRLNVQSGRKLGLQTLARFALLLLAVAHLGATTARADFLYGVTDIGFHNGPNGVLVKIDPNTGNTTMVGDANLGGIEDIEQVNGQLLVTSYVRVPGEPVNHNGLYSIDPDTAKATYIGQIRNSTTNYLYVEGLANVNGVLYGSARTGDASQGGDSYCPDCSNHLIMIDPKTGQATEIGKFGAAFQNVEDIAYSPQYGLIGVDIGTLDPSTNYQTFNTKPALIKIDLNAADKNNIATKIADLPPSTVNLINNPNNDWLSPEGPFVCGLDFAPDGTLYGSTWPTHFGGTSQLIKINPLTGAITDVGTIGGSTVPGLQDVDGILYVKTIPEPGSLALVTLGGIGLLAYSRRRRRMD